MRQVMVAAVGAAVVASVAVTVLVNGMLFAGAPAGSAAETGPAGEPEEIIQGDVDCDGDVDATDALKDLQHVAGLPFGQNDPCPDIGTTAAIPGPPGPAGPPGVSEYEVVLAESESNSDSLRSLTADCPPGKSVFGGGARVVIGGGSLDKVSIYESRPVGANWRASATEISGGTEADWYLEVRAVCLKVGE